VTVDQPVDHGSTCSTIRRTGRLEASLDAGEQLHLRCPAAAAGVAHAGEDLAQRPIAPWCAPEIAVPAPQG
jgi:hypothetical protein